MSARQVEWAHKTARSLRKALGFVCAKCPQKRRLEFDCIIPQGHKHHRIGFTWRMSFYRQQFAAGNLQLLCKSCHASKTYADTYEKLNSAAA